MRIKYILLLNVFLIVSAFFTTKFATSKSFTEFSSIFIIFFAIPCLIGLYKSFGSKALIVFLTLGCFAIIFEYYSIITGIPYGKFSYTSNVGLKIADTVPWSISFAWVPLLLGSFLISIKSFHKKPFKLIFLSAIILVVTDFILDPGAVSLSMWIWVDQSFLYKIPLSNYFGWFISGFAGSTILYLFSKKSFDSLQKSKVWFYISLYVLVGFWTYIDMFKGLFIAALVGFILMLFLTKELIKSKLINKPG